MAELSERKILESDIDWYCLINGRPTHIASMGGMIPKQFRDRGKLRMLQNAVAGIEPFAEIKLNLDYIKTQIEKGYEYLQDEMIRKVIEEVNKNDPGFLYLDGNELAVRLFASTFAERARRGFRSFARGGVEGKEYVLIAEPVSPVTYKAGEYQLVELVCSVNDEGRRITFD